MINIPFLARGFAVLLIFIALALAVENTLISAEVLMIKSGASALSSVAIAVGCTSVEIAFASWAMKEDSFAHLGNSLVIKPKRLFRLFAFGLALALVYHFDILTTSLHPKFQGADGYFFAAVVGCYVFGPELVLIIGWWLWHKAGEEETKLLAKTNSKAAENVFWRSNRERAIAIAKVAGSAYADKTAAHRWGPKTED